MHHHRHHDTLLERRRCTCLLVILEGIRGEGERGRQGEKWKRWEEVLITLLFPIGANFSGKDARQKKKRSEKANRQFLGDDSFFLAPFLVEAAIAFLSLGRFISGVKCRFGLVV